MSGPIAATFTLGHALVLVAAEAIRAVRTIAQGYSDERQHQSDLQAQRQAEDQQAREASLAGRRAFAEQVERDESRLRRLISAHELLAAETGTTLPALEPLPAKPPADDTPALTAWHESLLARIAMLDAAVADAAKKAGAVSAADVAAMIGSAPSLDEQLAAFEAQARLSRTVPADIAAERRKQLQRILARLVTAEYAALPEDLDALAAEFMRTLSGERAEALATELRLRVDRLNQAATNGAAAIVLEQSLRDLGYEVDGIGETLFVEGGVAHFQKAGWDDYFVRLRVDPARGAINFNVVRSGTAGEDRKREDLMAEERWCAEFPKLQQTLAARGLNVTVTRMLGAGEVPVQIVEADTLPERARQDEARATSTPKAMQRP